MAGVYAELRAFVMEHRKCAGSRPSRCELTHSLWLQRPPEVRLRAGVHALGDAGGCGRGSATVGAAGIRELVPPDASSRRGSAQTAADAFGGAYRLDACATLPPYGQLHCGWQAPSARVRFDYPRRSLKDHCAARDRSHGHSTRNQRDGRRTSAGRTAGSSPKVSGSNQRASRQDPGGEVRRREDCS